MICTKPALCVAKAGAEGGQAGALEATVAGDIPPPDDGVLRKSSADRGTCLSLAAGVDSASHIPAVYKIRDRCVLLARPGQAPVRDAQLIRGALGTYQLLGSGGRGLMAQAYLLPLTWPGHVCTASAAPRPEISLHRNRRVSPPEKLMVAHLPQLRGESWRKGVHLATTLTTSSPPLPFLPPPHSNCICSRSHFVRGPESSSD